MLGVRRPRTQAHPKFYATPLNHACIWAHMFGGTVCLVGPFVGCLLNNKPVIFFSTLMGMLFHLPTARHATPLHPHQVLKHTRYRARRTSGIPGHGDCHRGRCV